MFIHNAVFVVLSVVYLVYFYFQRTDIFLYKKAFNRLYTFDFLRFIAATEILWFHLTRRFGMTTHGLWAIDLFFIISGFFLAKNISAENYGKVDTGAIIFNKIKSWYPVMLFSIMIALCFAPKMDSWALFSELTFIEGSGLYYPSISYCFMWFLSSYLIAFYIFHRIMQYQSRNIIVFCITLIAMALMFKEPNIYSPRNNILSPHILRAFCGMGLGILTFEISKFLKTNNITLRKPLVAIMEIFAFSLMLISFHVAKIPPIFAMLSFVLIVFCFALGSGLIAKLFNRKLSYNIARYTFSLYMIHYPLIEYVFPYLRAQKIIDLGMYWQFLLVWVAAIVVYHMIESKKIQNILTYRVQRNEGDI